jgi:hypothetical protein
MIMSAEYDFNALYGRADLSGFTVLPKGNYDAVVTKSEWGRTKDGTKGMWTVETVITTGEHAGTKRTGNITVSLTKNDGSSNEKGLGMMFRQLSSLGVPVPPDQQPFWQLGWTEQQVAQSMVGKPVMLRITVREAEGDYPERDQIRDFLPPRPGAPLQVQQKPGYGAAMGYEQNFAAPPQQPQFQPYQQQGQDPYAQQQPAAYGQQPQNGYPQQPPQGGPAGYGGQQGTGQTAPGPWQNAQQPAAGQQQVPGAPSWAQPPQPGQGGTGEFTPQGQSQQPSFMPPGGQQPPQQNQWQPPQYQPPQAQFQSPLGQPPQQPNGYQQQPQPQQQQQGAPELPPWAQ